MSEHHPEETMPVVASDPDCPDLSDELIDELLAGARTPEEIAGPVEGVGSISLDLSGGRDVCFFATNIADDHRLQRGLH